jgi:hypothetical protein
MSENGTLQRFAELQTMVHYVPEAEVNSGILNDS